MLSQKILRQQYLTNAILSLNENEVIQMMNLLQHRLSIMQSPEYYLHIPVTDLPLPPGVISALLERQIPTVRELQLCDWEQVKIFPRVGEKRVLQLQTLLKNMEERKELIKGLTGEKLRAAVM
jgi:hypothetical protein